MTPPEQPTRLVLGTERALRPHAEPVPKGDSAAAKVLLIRDAALPFSKEALPLLLCTSDSDWWRYEDARVPVEATFGLDERAARAMVRRTRERGARLGMRLEVACPHGCELVAGVGAFRHPGHTSHAARLQEVDVFPSHRGRGLGVALLEGARRLLVAEGVRTLVVGADEDDWPLAWYRRLGFTDALRVSRG